MDRAEVDTIQLRCRADRIGTARQVDGALRTELTAPNGLLLPEFENLTQRFGPAEHICVRRLAVVLRLRVSRATGISGIRRAWLAAATQAIRALPVSAVRRIRPGVLVSADGGVVIYERHLDAITDLVLGLSASATTGSSSRTAPRAQDPDRMQTVPPHISPAHGPERAPSMESTWDPEGALDGEPASDVELPTDVVLAGVEREWAWEQCGLVSGPLPRSGSARAEAITRALISAPHTIPAVLARVDASLPLTRAQWVAVALAWTRSQGSIDETRPPSAITTIVADSPVVRAALRSPVVRALAADPRTAARLSLPERRMLARLALACSVPHHSRDAAVDVVAESLAMDPPTPITSGRQPAAPSQVESTTEDQLEIHEVRFTEYGGLLFLALAIDPVVTEIVVDDLPGVLARLCGRLAGVPPTDPVVPALAGIDPVERLAPPDDELDALIENRIRRWTLARLQADPADEDLAWVWRRRAGIQLSPGWIEAEFSLDDVDLRIRRVLLDADPGWLWWRGAALRYRYV